MFPNFFKQFDGVWVKFDEVFETFNSFTVNVDDECAVSYKQTLKDGTIEIFKNGRLHNETGPAVVKKDGTKEYWLAGRQVTEQDITKLMKDKEEKKQSSYTVNMTKAEKEKVEKALGRKL